MKNIKIVAETFARQQKPDPFTDDSVLMSVHFNYNTNRTLIFYQATGSDFSPLLLCLAPLEDFVTALEEN